MRTITKSFPVYKFGEAPEEVKKKILEKHRDINVVYDWWECFEEDLRLVGIGLCSFHLDRMDISLKYRCSLREVCEAIVKNHGDGCETYMIAWAYLQMLTISGDATPEAERNFKSALEKVYIKILREEYDWRMGDVAVIETLVSTDSEFTEDGKIYNQE